MTPRNEPSALQIVLDEVRLLRQDATISNAALRSDMARLSEKIDETTDAALDRAEKAHERIDKYENRFWGWVIGISGVGIAGGMSVVNLAKSIAKSLAD